MSSNGQTDTNQDPSSPFQLAQQHFKEKKYLQASLYYEKAIENDPTNSEIYLLKSQCSYSLSNLEHALHEVNYGLEKLETNSHEEDSSLILKVRLFHLRSRIYQEMKDFENAKKDKDRVKRILQSNAQNHELSKVLEIEALNESSFKTNDASEHREYFSARDEEEGSEKGQEAQTVYDLIQDATEKQVLTTEFNIAHLVSTKWFDKWKRYTNFNHVLHKSKESYNGNNANDSDIRLLKEDQESVHPGPINSDDILDLESKFLQDPDKVKEYCNSAVKQGLVENIDFIILPHNVWKYLHKIYSGKDIKRYVISVNDETNQTSIEIWLKKINVLVCPPINKNQSYQECEVQTLYISKKEAVKDLKEKVTRTLQFQGDIHNNVNMSSCRLWKLDPKEDYSQFVRYVAEEGKENEAIPIKGKKLPDGQVLEDAELGDTDIVICEYKVNKSWRFMTEEEHYQLIMSRCANCGAKADNLPFCECKTVKYCDAVCQKNHRPQHKDKCNKVKYLLNKNHEIMKQFKLSKSNFIEKSRYGVCGLQNLGNTCFMNSSLQCLSHVTELTYYFLENNFIKDLNKHNRLGTGGRLAAAYAELMKELWHGTDNYVSPWDIKKIIAEVASQFSGYNQQDAAEFLSYLVDGLHEDLNKIINKPYLGTIESDDRPDDVVAKQSWENHIKRNQSIIVDLMHGQFKSKLICPDCHKISITFDPFMTLSLPIPHITYTTMFIFLIYKDPSKLPDKINLTLDPTSPALSILQKVSELTSIPEEALELHLLRNQCLITKNLNKFTVDQVKNDEGMPFVYQIHDKEVDGSLHEFLKQDKIRLEIKIYQDMGNEQITFSRMIYIPLKITLKELHLRIYNVIRGNLAHLFTEEDDKTPPFSINVTDPNPKVIAKEYEFIRKLGEEKKDNFIYEVVFVQKGDKNKDELVIIPNIETKQIGDLFPEVKWLTLRLIFNNGLNLEGLKFNKCLGFEGTNKVPKDQRVYSLYDCFDLFTKPEILDEDNLWYCNKCKEHKQATKKMDVYKLPSVLILHLKRFKTSRVHSIGSFFFSGGSSKITTLVDFPLEGLDLSKYTLGKWEEPPIYDLFAVTNHYGSLGGGHYTAYAKSPLKKLWYDFNDSSVSRQSPDEIVTSAGYLLFYKKREVEKGSGSSNS